MSEVTRSRNKLNDLTNREWLMETKSFWLSRAAGDGELPEAVDQFVTWLRQTRTPEELDRLLDQPDASFVYSVTPPRSKLKARHPATFSEADVERLIRFFSKEGERVLDPFVGSGSALIACASAGRNGVGIELSPEWAQTARERILTEAPTGSVELEVVEGDAAEVVAGLSEESVDFVVTSPPYWSILTKKAGVKAKAEREAKGLPTQYSEDARDLGNIQSYDEFLDTLADILGACLRPLRAGRFMTVIVSDFRHGPRFYLYHADLAAKLEDRGWQLKGITILAQDNKNLYPFGVGSHFVSNIHHQYILILQKPKAP